ncbi:MAG TPA: hypothetical protein VLQ29_07395 [Candidatus Dormibacteraeota bacterium]|nr:hypothetical protein [Candidatus Dormibacteraeota bacterium]
MNNQPVGASRIPKVTWLGLFVALFGMLIARQIAYYISPTLTFTTAVWKESLIWLCVIALLVIIRRGERLPLTSVGIGTCPVVEIDSMGIGHDYYLCLGGLRNRSRHPLRWGG